MSFRAAAVIFRATSRTIFSPATALPFFSWLRAPNTPLIAPILELLALHAQISPRASAAVVFGALRAQFFPPTLYSRLFYDTSCSNHTPVWPPSRARGAPPPIFTQLNPIFPRPLHCRFPPQNKIVLGSHPYLSITNNWMSVMWEWIPGVQATASEKHLRVKIPAAVVSYEFLIIMWCFWNHSHALLQIYKLMCHIRKMTGIHYAVRWFTSISKFKDVGRGWR